MSFPHSGPHLRACLARLASASYSGAPNARCSRQHPTFGRTCMTESLALEERVRIAVATGESYFREFKSALAGPPGEKAPRAVSDIMVDIGRTLVAFANADGGELLIGVEDDGQLSGVPHSEQEIEKLFAATTTHVHADTPLPVPRKSLVRIGGHAVLYFHVPKGTDYVHLTADGRCLRRADRESVPVSAESITHTRLEERSRAYDRSFSWGAASISDLDLDLIGSVASQVAHGISPEKCLQYLDLAEFGPDGLRLRNAALLLFAKNVSRWHARCQVRITSYQGVEAAPGRDFVILKDDVIVDNVLTLTETAWERLQVAISQQTSLSDQAKFEQTYLYPQVACREALINAIVHRDYAVEGRGIEVSLFSDRMEIVSPGALLSTVSLDELAELEGAHESRNPLVARVLREVGLVREMGEGIRRIFEVMKSSALAAPTLSSESNTFKVSLYNRSLYDSPVHLWLSNFDHLDLDESQRAVLALGYGGRTFSTQDIIDRLGLIDVDRVRVVVTPLREAGAVTRTLTDVQMLRISRNQSIPKRQVPVFRVVTPGMAESPAPSTSGESTSSEERVSSSAPAPASAPQGAPIELYVGNLDYSVSIEMLTQILAEFGDVESVDFPGEKLRDRANNGFCFATIVSVLTFDELSDRLSGRQLGGRRIVVQQPRRLTPSP